MGGNQLASHPRQGEGRAIVGFLSELDLQLLLPRGTITYTDNSRGGASTIDLVMSTSRLFSERVSCKPHGTEHGSDHLAIVTKFLIDAPEVALTPRRLYKNGKWEVLNGYVKDHLASIERIDPVAKLDEYTTKLTKVVMEGIELSVPIAKPSPYNKRWWAEELSQLRRRYTVFRNQARRRRRNNQRDNTVLYSVAKAAKQDYHSALRKQKKQHWEEFLDEPGNIWDTCRYINDNPNIANFAPISALQTSVNATVTTNPEIAQGFLSEFFPPLPDYPESLTSSAEAHRNQLPMAPITPEEIFKAIFSAAPLKGAGPDTIPALVWQKIWPTAKHVIVRLFTMSIELGVMPDQWKTAKIIPLRMPQKDDYTLPSAYRAISLLATLGKMLESLIAQRIAFLAEEYSLLPYNHFGDLKQKTTVDALLVLQEKIYQAWKDKKVLSLITFDVKGAFNGVAVGVLIDRLRKRRLPKQIICWVKSFCDNRKATVSINGETSGISLLPQAGVPQGSPLSPILYLFFNADLVEGVINKNKGSLAFIDDLLRG